MIPGDHTALIDEPYARAWAERMDNLLSAARERGHDLREVTKIS